LKPAHFKLSQNKDQEEMLAAFYKSLHGKASGTTTAHCTIKKSATMYDYKSPTSYSKNDKFKSKLIQRSPQKQSTAYKTAQRKN